ncbi:MAG: hypothetical protein HYV42_05285 [Candidatus Magasanikbacteria bacterium]|nr:hypothetical protein [Candidatus Magasanikbacteria bacterium]
MSSKIFSFFLFCLAVILLVKAVVPYQNIMKECYPEVPTQYRVTDCPTRKSQQQRLKQDLVFDGAVWLAWMVSVFFVVRKKQQ